MTILVNKHNIRFPIDEEGNVDVKNCQYGTNNQPKKAAFEHEQEGRFCLGVAKIESKNGKITGKRCPVFEYTGKKIVTIDAYKKEIIKEFATVRQITSSLLQWIKKTNTDKVWLYESVGKLKGLGQLAISKMNELRIHTIADLQLHFRHRGKVHIRGFDRIYAMAFQALLGKPSSSFKDHRKSINPYHSRYGEGWVEKLKSSTAMSKFCCITDLICFMMNESETLMKGSVHEDDLYIVHDALVLMTTKETINWMKQKGYLHRWLLSLNGLQDGTPFAGRPVGNSPEFMPLDNSLNRDILQSLRFHCVLSHAIIDGKETTGEERKLRFSPRAISLSVDKLKHNFLSSFPSMIK